MPSSVSSCRISLVFHTQHQYLIRCSSWSTSVMCFWSSSKDVRLLVCKVQWKRCFALPEWKGNDLFWSPFCCELSITALLLIPSSCSQQGLAWYTGECRITSLPSGSVFSHFTSLQVEICSDLDVPTFFNPILYLPLCCSVTTPTTGLGCPQTSSSIRVIPAVLFAPVAGWPLPSSVWPKWCDRGRRAGRSYWDMDVSVCRPGLGLCVSVPICWLLFYFLIFVCLSF